MVNIFFGGWDAVLRVVVVGALAYLALVVLLQASGNRSLAQTRSFDFVVTVAIGATLGGVLTGRSVAIVEAVVAFGVLIGLQYLVTALQMRSESLRRAVTQRPVLLAHQGEPLHDALRDHRLTLAELHTAVRRKGFGSLAAVEAVVLEADGEMSVVGTDSVGDGSALAEML